MRRPSKDLSRKCGCCPGAEKAWFQNARSSVEIIAFSSCVYVCTFGFQIMLQYAHRRLWLRSRSMTRLLLAGWTATQTASSSRSNRVMSTTQRLYTKPVVFSISHDRGRTCQSMMDRIKDYAFQAIFGLRPSVGHD